MPNLDVIQSDLFFPTLKKKLWLIDNTCTATDAVIYSFRYVWTYSMVLWCYTYAVIWGYCTRTRTCTRSYCTRNYSKHPWCFVMFFATTMANKYSHYVVSLTIESPLHPPIRTARRTLAPFCILNSVKWSVHWNNTAAAIPAIRLKAC